jgi:hypothetical protein
VARKITAPQGLVAKNRVEKTLQNKAFLKSRVYPWSAFLSGRF